MRIISWCLELSWEANSLFQQKILSSSIFARLFSANTVRRNQMQALRRVYYTIMTWRRRRRVITPWHQAHGYIYVVAHNEPWKATNRLLIFFRTTAVYKFCLSKLSKFYFRLSTSASNSKSCDIYIVFVYYTRELEKSTHGNRLYPTAATVACK